MNNKTDSNANHTNKNSGSAHSASNRLQSVDGIRHHSAPTLNSVGNGRIINTPPTRTTQKSATLARAVVQKPINNAHAKHFDVSMPIIGHKKPTTNNSAHKHHKHEAVKRLAVVPTKIAEPIMRPAPKQSFVPIKKTEEMIQEQLSKANAHLMTYKKPRIKSKVKKKLNSMPPLKRRFAIVSSTALFALILAGVLVYWNLPGISMTIASQRAGFDASLPSYNPNGFSVIMPIGYTKDRIVINFKSNTNDMKYSIEQKPSEWTSDVLRDQVASSNGNQFQTQSIKGLTVYFTAENSATWVDRGLLFTFQGNSGLTSEQIASIAASM